MEPGKRATDCETAAAGGHPINPTFAALQRRVKGTLFTAQALGSAGFLVASTVTPIVGARLSGRPSWAGVPTAFYWGGAAVFAILWGRLMDPLGRRLTLALGLAVGVAGAAVASAAIGIESFSWFVAGLLLMGAANAALQLGRFVAGEVHRPEQRGRAIATVVMGGTVGAVLGPTLVAPMSLVAESFSQPGLAGPYAAAAGFFLVGAVVVVSLLRPDPSELARALVAVPGVASRLESARPLKAILSDSAVRAAIITMTLSQAVMTMLMVITSLHMSHHGHVLANISGVMSAHVLGMFAFSMVAGRLADRWGRGPLIATGATLLLTAGLGAAPSVAALPLGAVLFLLGLGWNFCYVGGSTLLSDRLSVVERARVQGVSDAILTGTAALGSILSGVVFSLVGYSAMGLVCALVALVPLSLGLRLRRRLATESLPQGHQIPVIQRRGVGLATAETSGPPPE